MCVCVHAYMVCVGKCERISVSVPTRKCTEVGDFPVPGRKA